MSTTRTTSSRRATALLAGAASLCGILAWLVCSGDGAGLANRAALAVPDAAASAAAALATESAAPARADAEQRSGYYIAPVGTALSYVLEGHCEYSLVHPEAGRQPSGFALRAGLEVVVADRRDDEILVQVALADLTLAPLAGAKAPAADQFVTAARLPFHVRLAGDGAVRGYRFADGLTSEQRNFMRGLFSAYAHRVAADAQGTWEATDVDAAGEFVARFTLAAGGTADTAEVTRQKLRYQAMAGDELHPHEIRGQSRATFSRALGWLAEVEVNERTVLTMAELGLQVDVATVYDIRLRTQGTQPFMPATAALWDEPWLAAAGHHEDFTAVADERERARWSDRLADATLSSLIADLQGLLAVSPPDPQAIDAAWQAIVWLVKLRTDAAADIQRLVRAGMETQLADMLVSALGAAGTEPAQGVLAAMRHDATLPAAIRTSATIAMFQLAQPNERVLGDLVHDVRGAPELTGDDAMAMLLLGTLAPRAGAARIAGQTALDALLACEGKARGQDRLDLWLNALGNAGTPEVVPHAERLRTHEREHVRAAAYHAVRQVGTPAAAALLERGLADPAASVRTDVVSALGEHRSPAARALLVRAARDDADPQVRRAAHRALAPQAKPGSDAWQALEQAAQGDPDHATREMARELLRSLR